jgi:hypothetical protein
MSPALASCSSALIIGDIISKGREDRETEIQKAKKGKKPKRNITQSI